MFSHIGIAQNTDIKIESAYFDSTRTIRYMESKGFDSTKPYQLFVIFDETTLYDYCVSTINYVSQWKEIPQFIALGIPNDNRWNELQTNKGQEFGDLPFYKLMQEEFEEIPCVKKAAFRVLIGHSLSARFALQYFLKNNAHYAGLIAISPPIVPEIRNELIEYFERQDKSSYLYICSGDEDLRFHSKYFLDTQKKINPKINPNVKLEYFQNQPYNSHTLMPITGLKNGLLFLLDDFLNLPSKEIQKQTKKTTIQDSLFEKAYKRIFEIYGLKPKSRFSDIQNYVEVYLKKSNFTEAHRLSDLFLMQAIEGEVYDLIDAYYLKGLVYEKQNNYSLALKYYEKGYSIIPIEVINKSDFEEDILRVEKIISRKNKK